MATFRYQAFSASGETLQGQIEAASEAEAIAKLQEQGHLPLRAERVDVGERAPLFGGFGPRKAMSDAQVLQFTQQLATLLGAGQPLDRALAVLMEQPEDEGAKAVIGRIRESVRGGAPLSAALEQQHGLFSRLYVNLVRAGELGGSLQPALQRLADYQERMQALKSEVIGALVYPVILLVMVLASLVMLVGYLLPQMEQIFVGMDIEMGLLQRFIFGLAGFLNANAWWLIIAFIAGMFYLLSRFRDPRSKPAIDAWLLRRGRLGDLLGKLDTARFARTLGTLLHNGVPLLTALGISRQVVGNSVLAAGVEQAMDDVKNGQGLAWSLNQAKAFPRLALQMIQVGEESGQLPAMLLKTADTFDTETQRAIQRFLAALVPVVTILLAIVVGVVLLAILMPMLNLTSSVG